MNQELIERLREAYEQAESTYRADGGDWNAGRLDGLKDALEIVAEAAEQQ